MQALREYFTVKKHHWRVLWKDALCYYPNNKRFALCDLAIGLSSLFFNPYRICRKRGLLYGETSLRALEQIAERCAISHNDCWLDLGSGRGRGCFWMALVYGCRVIGIEKVPLFVYLGRCLAKRSGAKRLTFLCADLLEADLSQASCLYIYSTGMDEVSLDALVKRFYLLPVNARVVTVSTPLPENPHVVLSDSFPLTFPWGETEGYLHRSR